MKKASGQREIHPPLGASRHNSITPRTRGTMYKRLRSSLSPGIAQDWIQSGQSLPRRFGRRMLWKATTIQYAADTPTTTDSDVL